MGDWQLDPYHTQVEFATKHLGMMTVRGHFAEVSSVADIDPDHPEASSVEVTIQAASIRTHNETRDDDLRSSNFLEADKFPTMTFKSTSVVPAGTDRYTLTGDLTIKGTTRPVALQQVVVDEFAAVVGVDAQYREPELGLEFDQCGEDPLGGLVGHSAVLGPAGGDIGAG